jgi:capsid protein
MKILGLQIGGKKEESFKLPLSQTVPSYEANFSAAGQWGRTYAKSFDGEKNFGDMGPIIDYRMDYIGLRRRSEQAYLESEIARTVLNRFAIWIVDKGLRLECEPREKLLKAAGIDLGDTEEFNDIIEARFSAWANSKKSSYTGNKTFNEVAKDAFKYSKIGGDVLVVMRYRDGKFTVQVIDGKHVGTPTNSTTNEGRKIINGIEVDDKGKHVAYWVKKDPLKFERIEAFNKTAKMDQAFLVYGARYRIDDNRGIPVISTSLESMKKIERYKEAEVATAEEIAKVAYQVVHQAFSDGESPFAKQLMQMANVGDDRNQDAFPMDELGNKLADTVKASTNKQTFNNPRGAEIKPLNHGNGKMAFKDFYESNANIICASVGIPPNVAFSLYNDSFSASRAATKDWEHTISFERDDFTNQFYSRIFSFFLHIQVIEGNIDLPGYLPAFRDDDELVLEAYRNARFTGPMFPHIDPLKEVNAERAKLGPLGAHLPLTSLERSTEALFGGDSKSNIEQFAKELRIAEENGLKGTEPDEVDEVVEE